MKLSFIIYNHNLGLMLLKSECNMEGQIDQAKETTYKKGLNHRWSVDYLWLFFYHTIVQQQVVITLLMDETSIVFLTYWSCGCPWFIFFAMQGNIF
jgi:hypothetical protein